MRTLMVVWCVLGAGSAQAACPLPEVAFPSVAAGDPSFDGARTREVLQMVVAGAGADAQRARVDRLSVGVEVAHLGNSRDPALVSYEARSLATRLRQLDCAVWSNQVGAPDTLYRTIGSEALSLLQQAGGSPLPAATFDSDWRLAPPVVSSRQRADARWLRRRQIGGGVLIGLGGLLAAGSVALAVDAANTKPCTGLFCFNIIPTMEAGLAVAFGMGSIVSGVCGALLVYRKPKGLVFASVAPLTGGGFASLRMSF